MRKKQRNGLLVSIQHLLGEMLCRVAGGGGQSVLVQLPAQGGVRDDGVQCRCKLGFVLPLPAVEAVFHHAIQAGVRTAGHRQTAGHALEVGQALGLALGGADEDIAHAVPPGHLIGLDHAHKADAVGQLQLLCQCFQVRPGGTVAHKHQPWAVLLRLRGQQTHQLGVVLLGSQTAQREEDGIPFRDAQLCPHPGLFLAVVLRRAKGGQVDAGGHCDHRAADPVAVEHGAHLFGGGQHEGAIAREDAGGLFGGHPAQTLTEEKVLGIIFVDSMVGMYHRAVAPAGHPLCQHKGRKLALRMDDLRAPGFQLVQPVGDGQSARRTDPHARVDPLRADAAHIQDAVFLMGMAILGKGHHPHVMAQRQQLVVQQLHRAHHTVDHWGPCI